MKRWLLENKGFVLFMCLIGIFRTAVAELNPIPSGSMRPNLLEGDVVLVNRTAYNLKVPLTDVVLARLGDPVRGDVVTFYSPADGERMIKRVIALPGDVVEMRNEQLIINGKPAEYALLDEVIEPLGNHKVDAVRLNEGLGSKPHLIQVIPGLSAARTFAPVTIPQDQFLMLGDNRNNSADSRYFGLAPRNLLIGRAERVVVSADYRGNWMPPTERFGMSLR